MTPLLASGGTALSISPEVAAPIILILVLAEGFFSGSELALVSADRAAIRAAKEGGGRTGKMLANFLEEPERILTTTLIGTNVCTVSASTVFGLALANYLGEGSTANSGLLTVLCLSPIILLFGEFIPKSIFRRYSSQLAPLVIHPISWLSYGFFPLVWATRLITLGTLRALNIRGEGAMAVSRDELRLLLERGEDSANPVEHDEEIEADEMKMIQRIFDFPEITAKEVMVPLIDVTALAESSSLEEAAERFVETGFSRLPVFRERVDNIIGVLHAMDVLQASAFVERYTVRGRAAIVAKLMRPVTFVPPNHKVEELIETLQRQRHSLAVVVDEWGGAEGVITVEDILEEILGEIEDEHDEAAAEIRQRGEREYLVAARCEVDRINEELGDVIPDGDYETVAGFLIAEMGRIPDRGDTVETEGALLTVIRANERVVEEVQLLLRERTEEQAPGGSEGQAHH